MNVRELASETLARLNQAPDSAKRFFEMSSPLPRYAIGKNSETEQLNALVPLRGVIDDFASGYTSWRGIPVVRTHGVPQEALIANCSTSISPVAVRNHLARQGFHDVIGLHHLVIASDSRLKWPWFVQSMRKELDEHSETWQNIHDSLSDETSRRTFLDVICFRLSCDSDYMKNYTVRVQEQYFEDFMQFSGETFVDAGGFDGDTSEGFAKRYPDYRKIILFEPSAKNMAAAKKRLEGYRDIDYRALGLSDASETLNFDPDAGSASAIRHSAHAKIQVDTLDDTVAEPITFIKMDLEGWELKALHGSRRHLAQDRPKLAIAVYHDSPDFRLVYQLVNQFDHNYQCYLRHYTQGWSETVMFFV
jgi:FkbM family methyltransferase